MKQFSRDARLLHCQEVQDRPGSAFDEQMTTERCAELMAVGMANNLDEVWISDYPALLMVYLNQYVPNFSRWYVLLNVTSMFL